MTRVPYRIGEDVAAMYLDPRHGTPSLSPGYVSAISAHDTGWTVRVTIRGKPEPVEYRTSWSGQCDFLSRAGDHLKGRRRLTRGVDGALRSVEELAGVLDDAEGDLSAQADR